jgi:hypothetical protein
MPRAFIRLAVDLPREANLCEQRAHAVRADRVAHLREGRRQLIQALGYPQQWTNWIAKRRRLDKVFEISEQRRVAFDQW